jgi:hypothetical protein
MRIRYHINPDGEPHIYDHGVFEAEVREALERPLFKMSGRGDSTLWFGSTRAGRILKIVFTDARDGDVITAYELPPKQQRALRRLLKRKRS